MHAKTDRVTGKPTFDRAFCIRMKSTLTKRGCHFKSSGYRVRNFFFMPDCSLSKTEANLHCTCLALWFFFCKIKLQGKLLIVRKFGVRDSQKNNWFFVMFLLAGGFAVG